MDYKPFLDMKGKAGVKAAIDAFFAEVRRLFEEQGVNRQGLTLLGEELGKLATVSKSAYLG